MCSHVRRLFAGIEDGQSAYCYLRLDLACRKHSLALSGITRLFPIDRTNGYDYSYRSLANDAFRSSPTPFPSIVHSYCLLGVFPDRGSLTKCNNPLLFGLYLQQVTDSLLTITPLGPIAVAIAKSVDSYLATSIARLL